MVAITNPTMAALAKATPLVETAIYTSGGATLVKQIIITNPTAVAETYSISTVPGGGVGSLVNRIIGGAAIGPYDVATFDGFIVLELGDSLSALVTGGVVISAYGVVSD